jgi:phosphate/sulfate permease
VIGAGVAQNHRAIKWRVAQDIAFGWIVTIPSVAILAALTSALLRFLLRGVA